MKQSRSTWQQQGAGAVRLADLRAVARAVYGDLARQLASEGSRRSRPKKRACAHACACEGKPGNLGVATNATPSRRVATEGAADGKAE